MNVDVEIGIEAAHFPEKEHINGIFVAVHLRAYYDACILHALAL